MNSTKIWRTFFQVWSISYLAQKTIWERDFDFVYVYRYRPYKSECKTGCLFGEKDVQAFKLARQLGPRAFFFAASPDRDPIGSQVEQGDLEGNTHENRAVG